VRDVAEKSGTPYNKSAYDAESSARPTPRPRRPPKPRPRPPSSRRAQAVRSDHAHAQHARPRRLGPALPAWRRTPAPIAASSIRPIATPTTISSPTAGRSGEAERPGAADLRLFAGRESGGLSDGLSALHGSPASCTGKKVVYYPVQNNAAQIEAMRSGRLHISGFATGVVGFAVNLAGAVPFAVIGSEQGRVGLQAVRHGQDRQPLQDARRPQGQEGGAHLALVQLRQSRPARLLPRSRAEAGRRLQGADVGRATTSRCSASPPATTTWRRSPPTSTSAWWRAAR
jgi:hypothetical protein